MIWLKSKIKSLQSVIIFRYLLITSFPIIILGSISLSIFENHIETNIQKENRAVLNSLRTELQFYINNTETELLKVKSIIEEPTLIVSKSKINLFLTNALHQNLFTEFSILDSNGIIIFSSPIKEDLIGNDLSDHPNFKETAESGKIFWSNAPYSIQGSLQAINISFPINDNIIIGSLNLRHLNELLKVNSIREFSLIGIVDEKGAFVINTKLNPSSEEFKIENFEKIKTKITDHSSELIDFTDEKGLYTITKLNHINWYIFAFNQKSELFSTVYKIRAVLIVGILLSIIFVIYLSILTAKQILSPLHILNKQFENASEGNYQNIVGYSKYIEFNNTVLMFNKMLIKINAREHAIAQSEEKYKNLIDNSPDPILIICDNKIVFASISTLDLINADSIELLNNRDITDFIPPNRKEEVLRKIDLASRNYNKTIYVTEKIYTIDKKIKDVEVIVIPIFHENKECLQLIIRDITERLESIAKIKLQSKALETAPSGIMITNSDGIIVYANEALTNISQYSKSELIGQKSGFLKSGKHETSFYETMWNEILKGKIWIGEVINRKKDGTHYPSYLAITGVKNEDGIITNYISIHEDISQRKKFENDLIEAKELAEKADKLKSEFLAQMSHEIRTPINAILSFASLLRDELQSKVSEELKPSFSIISNAGKRLIRTIDMILDMSDIQAGTYDFIPRKLDLYYDVVLPIVEEFKYAAKAKKLTINSENISDDPDIYADEYTIKQVFSNLIDNSIKYTNEGSINIIVKDNHLGKIVEIIDTGIGISKENISLIFEPFRQEDQGYTRKFEGNGLGLALVKKYCEINSAQIEVESEKGKGSTFRVIF